MLQILIMNYHSLRWLVGRLRTKRFIRFGPRCYLELSPCSEGLYMGSRADLFIGPPGNRTRVSDTGRKHPIQGPKHHPSMREIAPAPNILATGDTELAQRAPHAAAAAHHAANTSWQQPPPRRAALPWLSLPSHVASALFRGAGHYFGLLGILAVL